MKLFRIPNFEKCKELQGVLLLKRPINRGYKNNLNNMKSLGVSEVMPTRAMKILYFENLSVCTR